jgi:hypothetical protein
MFQTLADEVQHVMMPLTLRPERPCKTANELFFFRIGHCKLLLVCHAVLKREAAGRRTRVFWRTRLTFRGSGCPRQSHATDIGSSYAAQRRW